MKNGISRRHFCLAVGTGAVAATLPACGGGATTAGEGADLALLSDMGKACPMGGDITAAGAGSALAEGGAVHVPNAAAFLVRDEKGLFAVSDRCTHQGTVIQFRSGSKTFYCPKHGSRFDLQGNVIMDPAVDPLPHYEVCVDGADSATIDPNTEADVDKRA